MKTSVFLVGLLLSTMICLAQQESDQNERREWARSYSLHSAPDGKDTGLEVLHISQEREQLLGGFVLFRQRKGSEPQLMIYGHLKKGDFAANVSLEVSDQEDQNWKTIESSFSDKVDVTLTAASHIENLFIDV